MKRELVAQQQLEEAESWHVAADVAEEEDLVAEAEEVPVYLVLCELDEFAGQAHGERSVSTGFND